MDAPVLFVTGFGAFSGVEDNPSKHIVQELEKSGFQCGVTEVRYGILEVSVEHCSKIHSTFSIPERACRRAIFVHIGVDSKASSIKLEQCAYNNMSFRVPDVRGYQPQSAQICSESELDCPAYSELPLAQLCDELNVAFPSVSELPLVQLSQDPGRYLCNYTYYQALQHQKKAGQSLFSLFVHVPPFEVIPEEQQVHIVKLLLEKISLFCSC